MFSVDLVWLQVFAVVEKAGTVVMNDGEELDSWSVLINGHVEVEHANGHIEHLQMGDRWVKRVSHTSDFRGNVGSNFHFCIH